MVKVQPFFKESKPTGTLRRRIRNLSKFYILPLDIAGDEKVKFSMLSWKTFVHSILHSTPFLITLLWFLLQPSDVLAKMFQAFKVVYTMGDIAIMSFFPGSMVLPLTSMTFTFIFCGSLPSISDLVLDSNLDIPRNYKRLMGSRALEVIGHFLVSLGNMLALGPFLPFTQLEMIIYVFLPIFIPASLHSSLIAFLVVSVFGIMEKLLLELNHCPHEGVIPWVKRNIDLFQRYQKAANLLMLVFITFR